MLFSKYWESSPKKQNLEKLLLISAELFDLEGIEAPQNLKKILTSKPIWDDFSHPNKGILCLKS
jgi:hypothetical protein